MSTLLGLREKITGFRGSVEAALFALRSGLQQRSDAAAAARGVLELLIDTFHIVSKNLPFVENMEKRWIQSASVLLDASLLIASLTG